MGGETEVYVDNILCALRARREYAFVSHLGWWRFWGRLRSSVVDTVNSRRAYTVRIGTVGER